MVELALGQQGLVVDAVLREGDELLEGVVHGVRPGVERRVMRAGRLVDAAGIGRQLVVEAVEEDALAAGDQPLLVGAVEIEVPGLGVLQLVVPVADAGQRRVDRHPFA